MTQQAGSTSIGRRSLVVCLVIVCVLAAIAVPAIYRANMAARRTASKYNLQNLVLSLHNYAATNSGQLPPGAVLSGDGKVTHGWLTESLPYLDSNPIADRIDNSLPWDHRLNRYNFVGGHRGVNIPGVKPRFVSEGFGATHYLANPNAMHRDSTVRFDDMTEGRANFWVLGEARSGFTPWGYPFNWRELNYPLGQDNGYGGPWGATQFAMADGSVRLVDNDVSDTIVEKLKNQPPLATAAATLRPDKKFAPGDSPLVALWEREPGREGSPAFQIQYSSGETPTTAFHFYRSKSPSDAVTADDIRAMAEAYPELREIFGYSSLTDESLDAMRQFKSLQVLSCGTIELTAEGLDELKKLSSLQILRGYVTPGMSDALRLALPNCELHLTLIATETAP